jgi:alkanesulfonate monooxygenase SsuD/methylene tetrahydromethanopterin reductase-like flavin-dependent oxidoreductase (luciferase family)
MKLGIFMMGDATGTYHDMVHQASLADNLGFHSVWLAERHLANGDLLWPSPMVAASYISARTRRIRIGLAARILPFHHPLHVAADALTLDMLSRGRFDLGLSRGSMDDAAHAAFGVSREEARSRFDEQYEVLRLACRGERFSFKGRYYDLEDVTPSPRPVQRPHPPFFVVANNPLSLDDAADRNLPVFAHGALDGAGIARTAERYRSRASAAGMGAGGEIVLNRFVHVGRTDEEAQRTMREPFMRFLDRRAPDLAAYLEKTFGARARSYDFLAREICVFGSAERCAARLDEIRRRAGVAHVLCTFNLITLDHRRCVESMQRFAADVMPLLVPAASRTARPGAAAQPTTEVTHP